MRRKRIEKDSGESPAEIGNSQDESNSNFDSDTDVSPNEPNWADTNQAHLMSEVRRARGHLEHYLAKQIEIDPARNGHDSGDRDFFLIESPPVNLSQQSQAPQPALETLCRSFGLSYFERDILLLCAGIELDGKTASLCQSYRGVPNLTFGLALAMLPDAHWSALSITSPLRRWHMVAVGSGSVLTQCPLNIEERVLHYLTGVASEDERLQGLLQNVPLPAAIPVSQEMLARKLELLCTRNQNYGRRAIVQLCGSDFANRRAIASAACARMGLRLHAISSADLPQSNSERETLARLWERESVLSGSALLLEMEDSEGVGGSRAALSFLENCQTLTIVSTQESLRSSTLSLIRMETPPLPSSEQLSLWRDVLGERAELVEDSLEQLSSQFHLSAQKLLAVGSEMRERDDLDETEFAGLLWEACRSQARPRLDDLAQRITPAAYWDDLVLPEEQRETLREIAANVRQRVKVYEKWGFAGRSARGLGISALFAGASGTGKTMAAEVLAAELELDLYRIDLSSVVSKYIGETEKNLRRVFDAAEEGGAILLFDEADALFGKRSEVKDSHDRYANIEVSYLLQRMEAYTGLAILTTNLKSALDTAFLRRIRFIVNFPFPESPQRREIWEKIFPAETPTHSLDWSKLARLNVAGGSIRNIALNAAFLAADENIPVEMRHLLRAARSEYAKLEKPLNDVGDW